MNEQNLKLEFTETAATLLQSALNLRRLADCSDSEYQLFLDYLPNEVSELFSDIRTASKGLPTVEDHKRVRESLFKQHQTILKY